MPVRSFCFFLILFASAAAAFGQDQIGAYQVRISLDHANWNYELGQKAVFTIAVTLNNSQVAGLPVKYACGPEQMPPTAEGSITTSDKPFAIELDGMKQPGFLRCIAALDVGGRSYRGLATAGYRPDQIRPVTAEPKDFDRFWQQGRKALDAIPLETKMERLPDLSTSKVDVFHVSFQNVGSGISKTSRIYGILAIPKTSSPEQRFPALLRVPGAGVRPYTGSVSMAERGFITLEIGIHGIPVTLPASVYDDLRSGALNRYMLYNLDDKDSYYYRRVYLGCLRANDFLVSLPQYNGRDLGVIGSSQGGALSIMTAALDKRVKALAAMYPALGDTAGYVAGRAGGWPHAFRDEKMRSKEKLETASYYDAANFARRLTVPGLYGWGYNDEVVPPTSMFAVYNLISAPKRLQLSLEIGHTATPEQMDRMFDFLETSLTEGK